MPPSEGVYDEEDQDGDADGDGDDDDAEGEGEEDDDDQQNDEDDDEDEQDQDGDDDDDEDGEGDDDDDEEGEDGDGEGEGHDDEEDADVELGATQDVQEVDGQAGDVDMEDKVGGRDTGQYSLYQPTCVPQCLHSSTRVARFYPTTSLTSSSQTLPLYHPNKRPLPLPSPSASASRPTCPAHPYLHIPSQIPIHRRHRRHPHPRPRTLPRQYRLLLIPPHRRSGRLCTGIRLLRKRQWSTTTDGATARDYWYGRDSQQDGCC